MKKLYSLVIEKIDTDTNELVSRKIMGVSHSIEKLKEHFFEVNAKFFGYDVGEMAWNLMDDNSLAMAHYDIGYLDIFIIDEVNFIQ